MTTEGHKEALIRRHRELDRRIEAERNHPSHDEMTVAALKRRKLEIKDELARLEMAEDA